MTTTNTTTAKKYNKSTVLKNAWKFIRMENNTYTWSECLKQAWNVEKNGFRFVDITTIYKKHYQQIYYFIYTRVGNKSEIAEELCNDVFLKAQRHLENYDVNIGKITTWLYHIAKNIVIDSYRTNHSDRYVNVGMFADAETGKEFFQFEDENNTNQIENDEISNAVHVAMSGLKPRYKQIAILFFIEQKKYNEIAEIMDISMSNVKVMINRVRTMLQDKLAPVMAQIGQ
jgi:RNA polymerase sigma-70 factor (ECF subfamily)